MSKHRGAVEKLDSPDHLSHHRWEWTIERLGWGLFACVIGTGLAGVLGPGPIGWRETRSADGSLQASYYTFERAAAPNTLVLWVEPEKVSSTGLELTLSRSFADSSTVETIVPEPLGVAVRGDQVVYTFAASGWDDGGKIVYRYKHEEFGVLDYEIAASGGEPVRVWQVVLP